MRFPASKTVVLHRNVEHRAACLALYRRLIKHAQNFALPVSDPPKDSSDQDVSGTRAKLKSIISKEFKKFNERNIKVSSIRDALKLGYKAEHCLRLAGGESPDPIEQARAAMFINLYNKPGSLPFVRMQSAKITALPAPKVRVNRKLARNPNIALLPPELRNRATLMAGNTLPFIRYSGTKMSMRLTGTLNSKMQQRLRREEKLDQIKCYLDYAEIEDELEKDIRANADNEWKKKNPVDKVSWRTSLKESMHDIEGKLFQQQVAAWKRSNELTEQITRHNEKAREALAELKYQRKVARDSAKGKTPKPKKAASQIEKEAIRNTAEKKKNSGKTISIDSSLQKALGL